MKTREIFLLLAAYFMLLTAFFTAAILIKPDVFIIKLAIGTTFIGIVLGRIGLRC